MSNRERLEDRAAELGAILARAYPMAAPHLIGHAVAVMRAKARWSKQAETNRCNYGFSDKQQARHDRAETRAQDACNDALVDVAACGLEHDPVTGKRSVPAADRCSRVELGGDPRGPCARLHIPGLAGDGWGDGFAVY